MAIVKKNVALRVVVELEYDDATDVVSRAMTAEWQAQMYRFGEEQEVLAYLAYYIGCREYELSKMDGWADLADDAMKAKVVAWSTELDGVWDEEPT